MRVFHYSKNLETYQSNILTQEKLFYDFYTFLCSRRPMKALAVFKCEFFVFVRFKTFFTLVYDQLMKLNNDIMTEKFVLNNFNCGSKMSNMGNPYKLKSRNKELFYLNFFWHIVFTVSKCVT